MARGFESVVNKDVEFQQTAAANKPALRSTLSREEREAQTRHQTLELTRARSELPAARSEPHRHMLERAVADFEEQLEAHR